MTDPKEKLDSLTDELIRKHLAQARVRQPSPLAGSRRLFVWAPIKNVWQMAAHLDWLPNFGKFAYVSEWIQAQGSYPLDPLNLPLSEEPYDAPYENDGIPGVVSDAGPDSWGRAILSITSPGANGSSFTRILATSGRGVGVIRVTDSEPVDIRMVSPIEDEPLERIEEACRKVSMGEALPTSEHVVLRDKCCGFGGACPKAAVVVGKRDVIAKFQNPRWDVWDMPVVEAACLEVARQAGIDAVTGEVISVNDRHVLLVDRFDRCDGKPIHYISARSLLDAFGDADMEFGPPQGRATYAAIVTVANRIGIENAGEAMFRRMAFNYAIGNTDDHLRNHGFLFDGAWRLAPAFDLVVFGGPAHSLGLGEDRLRRTSDNVLSRVGDFGLSREVGEDILVEAVNSARRLGAELDRLGMDAKQRGQVLSRLCPEAKT
ncbi:MAG: type II toxin-antitoxin system HipA family toxin [Rhizobiaceae bacterium]|nr:type II toxin-antitoxin system HipA family toxin [Rhizobiaceae bacterium]